MTRTTLWNWVQARVQQVPPRHTPTVHAFTQAMALLRQDMDAASGRRVCTVTPGAG